MKHSRHHRSIFRGQRTRLYRNPRTEDLTWFPENPVPGERYTCTVLRGTEISTGEILHFNPRNWMLCFPRARDR